MRVRTALKVLSRTFFPDVVDVVTGEVYSEGIYADRRAMNKVMRMKVDKIEFVTQDFITIWVKHYKPKRR